MSDERLRDLERAWRASGSVDDEAAYLRARRRAGELDEARLRLARHLGSPAAAEVLEVEPVPAPDGEPPELLAEWLGELAGFGRAHEVAVRALVAAVRPALPQRWGRTSHPDDRLQRAVEELEGWLRDPAPEALERLAQLEAELLEGYGWWGGTALVHLACEVARQPELAASALSGLRESRGQVVELLRAELIPWALGHQDPVRERLRTGGARVGALPQIVRGVAVSPDGAWAAGVCRGRGAVWPLTGSAPTTELEHPREGGGLAREVWCLAFLDDRRLVTGDDDGLLRRWDLASGEVAATRPAHEDRVNALLALPGERVLSGGYDGLVQLWAPGAERPTWSLAHARGVTALAAAERAGGLRTASVDGDGVALVADDGEPTRRIEHPGGLTGVALLPGGERLVTAGDEPVLRVWDLRADASPHELPLPAKSYALAVSPDGRLAAVAGSDCAVRLLDLEAPPDVDPQRACWWTLGLQFALAFSPDGRWLVCGGRNGAVRRYDALDPPAA